MPRMYIAGPLLSGGTLTFEEGLENWKKVINIADKLMQKGWSPYIPHHSLFMWKHIKDTQSRDIPHEEWMQLDSGFISVCTALYFVGHSKGADKELDYANDNGLTIYLAIDDVPNVKPNRCLLDE